MNKVIFSGIQPTGNLHIGNYLGAIKNWVELQSKYDSIFCIVDLHAITIDYDVKSFQQKILEAAAEYIACGIDPKKSIIFVQSHVPEHAELAWILNTIIPIGELQRMTQFKEKREQNAKNVNAGLFDYPVLMAADILLYHANLVPVGDDQKQHVELTRVIANKFNNKFGKTFTIPEVYTTVGARIMGLDNPLKKMSKSLGPKNYIALSDTPEMIKKKISRAVTDSGSEIIFSKNKPALYNLLRIYQILSDLTDADIESKFKGSNYNAFKQELARLIVEYFKPIQERRTELLAKPKALREILDNGAAMAQKIASKTMDCVKNEMGL